MKIQQASIKLFATEDSAINPEDFIAVFHRWIREKVIADKLLLDVVDYRHIPDGPGVMLIAHEAHYSIDASGGAVGLLYTQKRDTPRSAEHAFADALAQVLKVAKLLESEPGLSGSLRFRTDLVQVGVMSRLWAPNTSASHEALAEPIREVLAKVGLSGLKLLPDTDARKPFTLRVEASSAPATLSDLSIAL